MSPRLFLKGLLMIAILAGFGLLIQQTPLGEMLNEHWIDAHIRGQGASGQALFVGLAALCAALGFPRQIISFLGGYAFGLLNGVALALLATVLGCIVTFCFARLFGRRFIAQRLTGRVKSVDRFLGANPFSMALLIRLLPAGSNLLTNLAAGVSSARASAFLAGSALGFIPQTFIFALTGTGVSVDPAVRIGLSAVLFMLSAALGVFLYRRFRHGRSLDAELDRAIEGEAEPEPELRP